MSSTSTPREAHVELYLIWSVQDGDRFPHWMLMTVPALTDAQRSGRERVIIKGTRYHSSGGPTEGIPYRVAVQANTNFRSENVRNREYLCDVRNSDAVKLAKLANSIPAHQCQKYVVCVLALMQKRGMIPHGIAESLARRVQMSQRALDFEATHPAPLPVGIQLPPSWPTASGTSARVAPSQQHGRTTAPSARPHRQTPQTSSRPGNGAHGHPNQRPQTNAAHGGRASGNGRQGSSKGCCIMM